MKTRIWAIAFTLAGVTLAATVALFFVGEEASSAPGDGVADRVFGQGGSFTANTCNTAVLARAAYVARRVWSLTEAETST